LHAVPQAPQLAGSLFGSTQRPLQMVSPAGHVAVHIPFTHACPTPHAVPQRPQLRLSDWVLVHAEAPPSPVAGHKVWPIAHIEVHIPALQASPAGQTVPHMPQLFGSVLVLVHAMPQSVPPAGHTHAPAEQD
jgi:hypothetical protein